MDSAVSNIASAAEKIMPEKVVPQGILDNVKDRVDWTGIKSKFDFSQSQLIEMATYFGIGFFSGFLFKKYAKYLIVSIIVLVLALKYFNAFDFLTINWENIYSYLGLDSSISDFGGHLYNIVATWVKSNVAASVSLSVGFLVGYKVG